EFAQAPALRTLGSKVLRDGEPLDRPGQLGRAGRDHARQRGGELRPQRKWRIAAAADARKLLLVLAAVDLKNLRNDARAALMLIQLDVLEHRAFDFIKTVIDRHPPPDAFDVTAHRHVLRVEITRALGGLKLLCV